MFELKNIVNGATRGGWYGLVAGVVLGGVGYAFGPPIDHQKVLVWKNRFGKTTQFTYLDSVSILKNDLMVIHRCKKYNEDAYNETFRNIQSAIAIYYPIKSGESPGALTSSTKMTNYAKRASKAMEAILVSIKGDVGLYTECEASMMAIQLNLEDFINFVTIKTSKIAPSYGKDGK